jgi:hypothetical protein
MRYLYNMALGLVKKMAYGIVIEPVQQVIKMKLKDLQYTV